MTTRRDGDDDCEDYESSDVIVCVAVLLMSVGVAVVGVTYLLPLDSLLNDADASARQTQRAWTVFTVAWLVGLALITLGVITATCSLVTSRHPPVTSSHGDVTPLSGPLTRGYGSSQLTEGRQ